MKEAGGITKAEKPPVLVLGAGIIGLSVGVLLLEAGYPTTICTKAIPPNVTSSVGNFPLFPLCKPNIPHPF